MEAVDVSQPASPVPLGGVNVGGGAFDVQVVGNHAYVAGGYSGLQVLDVSNPANLVSVGGNDLGSSASAVQVVGHYAYVATQSGLQILELRLGYPNTLGFNPPAEVAITNVFLLLPPTSRSGGALAYTVLSGPARVEGDRLIFTGGGPVQLQAGQAGDPFYLPLRQEWTINISLPSLGVGRAGADLEFYWSASLTGFKLQTAESLAPGSPWQEVTAPPVEANGEASLRLGQPAPQGYFRLFKP